MENEFTVLDQLFLAKERVQLEIGWACNEWLEQQRKESMADESPRAALSYALNILSNRYLDTFSSYESARKNITTWMRVSKFFTREKVKEINAKSFTFHHLRKCYVGGSFPDANEAATNANLEACERYAKEHDGKFPPVNSELGHGECNLWDKFINICSRVASSEKVEEWQRKLAQKIIQEVE